MSKTTKSSYHVISAFIDAKSRIKGHIVLDDQLERAMDGSKRVRGLGVLAAYMAHMELFTQQLHDKGSALFKGGAEIASCIPISYETVRCIAAQPRGDYSPPNS